MAKITKLKDFNGDVLYPITILAAVYKDENQTTEEWLQSIIDQLKNSTNTAIESVQQTTQEAIDNVQKTTKERLDYYDNMAEELLSGSTSDLDAIVQQVEELATTKKSEINSLAETESQNIEDLASEKESELNSLAETSKSGLNSLVDGYEGDIASLVEQLKQALNSLASEKEGSINDLADTRENAINTLGEQREGSINSLADEKETTITDASNTFTELADQYTTDTTQKYTDAIAEIESLLKSLQDQVNEALDSDHLLKMVSSETGVHGIRYHDGVLQCKDINSDVWIDAGGSGGFKIQEEPPDKTNLLWIDTSNGGVLKYHNGENWVATAAVWG